MNIQFNPAAFLARLSNMGIGMLVIFVVIGLILLMIVVTILGAVFTASSKKTAKKVEPAPAAAPVAQEPQLAPGTAGQLKLHDVSPKTAAMLMAIVADKMGKPLNELRFISIKEVK